MRLECPHCATSYTSERLNLPAVDELVFLNVTVACPVCAQSFDAYIGPSTEALPRTLWHKLTRQYPTKTTRVALIRKRGA